MGGDSPRELIGRVQKAYSAGLIPPHAVKDWERMCHTDPRGASTALDKIVDHSHSYKPGPMKPGVFIKERDYAPPPLSIERMMKSAIAPPPMTSRRAAELTGQLKNLVDMGFVPDKIEHSYEAMSAGTEVVIRGFITDEFRHRSRGGTMKSVILPTHGAGDIKPRRARRTTRKVI